MTDHVPVVTYPPRDPHQVKLPAEVCAACSEGGQAVPAADCELARAVLQKTAYGKCPLGCGATGGDVEQSGDLAGFVRLWPHACHAAERLRPELRGDGACIGARSWVAPLPLAAPPAGERERLASMIGYPPAPAAEKPLTLF